MNTDPRDGIKGLAASAYATQWGAGVINPSFPKIGLTGTPRNSPAVGGVRYHVAQYVGGVVLYSSAPNALRLIGACSVHSRSPQDLAPVNAGVIFGSGAELPHDAGADCADGHKVRLPSLNKRAVGNGSLSEIFRQCLISRKPSQTLKHVDSSWFHCRRWELTGEESACVQEGFANS